MRSIILFCMLIFSISLYAQRPTKNVEAILLTKIKNDKVKFIDIGSKIHYWTTTDNGKIKGRLDSIGNNFMVTNNQIIYFDSLEKIAGRSTGMAIVNTAGKVIVVSGTLVTGLGAWMILHGYSIADTDGCSSALSIMFGVVFAAVGVGGAAIGAIPMLVHSKRYKVNDKWQIEYGTVPLKMSRKEMKEAGLK